MESTTIAAGNFAATPVANSSWMLDVLSEPINRFRVSDRVITYCNVAWANHYGVSVAEAVGFRLDDFLSTDELDGLHAQLELIGPDKPVLVDTVARVDSGATQRWLQWVDHYVVTDDRPEIISVGRDVTDRHAAVEALADSEDRFRALADQSSDIVWRIRGSRAGFDYLSPATEHILGFKPEHFIEDFANLLAISEPQTRTMLERFLSGDDLPDLIDLRVRHVDGRSVILESSVSSTGDVIQGVGRDVTEIRNLQSTLEEAASTDALTGLANRRSFDRFLDVELARTAAAGTTLGVVYIDLDKLKPINDRFGHDAGDLVLKEAARRLVACADGADTVARVGGDEFVILHEVRGDSIDRVVNRLHERFRLPMSISRSVSVSCSASVGVAETSSHGKTATELVAEADRAMYEAKQQRNRV